MNKFGLHTFRLPSFGISDFRLTSFGGDGDGGRKAALPSPDLYYDLSLKSNEHPTRNIIDDMSGNGRHATIYNALYAKGSGYGKYVEDFMSRFYSDKITFKEKTTSSITISKLIKGRGAFEYGIDGQWNIYDFKGYSIKVEGYPPNLPSIEFYVSGGGGNISNQTVTIRGDGIYTLSDTVFQQPNETTRFFHGLVFNTLADVDCNLTITQIPEYEGAFVFDGIDDYASIGDMAKGFKTLFMEVVPFKTGGMLFGQNMTDGVQVGGRNYVILSKLESYTLWNTPPVVTGNVISTKKLRTNAVTICVSGYYLNVGDTYTISGYMKTNGNPVTNSMWLEKRAILEDKALKFYVDDSTGRFEITTKYNSKTQWLLDARIQGEINDVITIEFLKFEKGNKATDWSPAPEDVFAISNLPNTIAYNGSNPNGVTYINGELNTNKYTDDMQNHRQVITIVNPTDTTHGSASIGTAFNFSKYYSSMALYKIIGFYDELTPEQIQKVITKYKLKYEQI